MSYILDALRKSEQERMRGKIPELNQFGQDELASPRSNRWVWTIGGVLVLINAVAVSAWLMRVGREAPSVSQQVVPSGATEQASAATTNSAAVPVQQTSATQVATPVPQNVQAINSPQTVPAAQPTTVYYVAPGTALPGQAVVVQGVPPAGSVVQMAPGIPAGAVVQVMPGTAMPYANTTTVVTSTPDTSNTVLPPPVAPPPPPVDLDQMIDRNQAAMPAMSYLPQLEELPENLRSQIPDMTFSSHMYSSMPKFRSVVINGSRVKEGQVTASNIAVREITETGVILGLGDTVFQVDVLGKWSQ